MPSVTYFVGMISGEGKAEKVRETLLTNLAIVGEEPGRVVFALHRSEDDPNEFPTTQPGRARDWLTRTNRAKRSWRTRRRSARWYGGRA